MPTFLSPSSSATLVCGTGSFKLTGIDATLGAPPHVIVLGTGAFTLAGQPASIVRGAPQVIDYNAWLADDKAARCLLVEITVDSGGTDTTRYLSTVGYTTGANDVPAHTAYLPLIAGGISVTEQISLDGSGGLTYGDIEIHNQSGEFDSWLDDVWVNKPIKIYFGDVGWARSEFRLVLDGIVADIDSRSQNRLNLKLRDKLQRLNTPISETKLGGSGAQADNLIPLTFGEVHNVTPLLAHAGLLQYQVHSGAIERVIEVRDNGVPVGFLPLLADGKFRLNAMPSGVITASVQGDIQPTYTNSIRKLIERLVTNYGKEADRFTAADLDTANLDAFEAAHPQPVGVYLDQRSNVLEVCQELAASVGAQLIMSRTGQLRLFALDVGAPALPDCPTFVAATTNWGDASASDAGGSTPAAPAFVSALGAIGDAGDTGNPPPAVAKPPNVTQGDLLLWVVQMDVGAGISFPSDWTVKHSTSETFDGGTITILTKIAGANEPSSYSASNAGTAGTWSNAMLAYRGANIAYDTSVASYDGTGSGSPWTLPTVSRTTAIQNEVLIWVGTVDNSIPGKIDITPPSGFNVRFNTPGNGAGNAGNCLCVADAVQSSAGASGNKIGSAAWSSDISGGGGGGNAGKYAALIAIKGS